MAKKNMLQREAKRKKLITKYSDQRKYILNELKKASSLEDLFHWNEKIQRLPKLEKLICRFNYTIIVKNM